MNHERKGPTKPERKASARRAAEDDTRRNLLAAGIDPNAPDAEDAVRSILMGGGAAGGGELLLTIAEFYTRAKIGKSGFYRLQKTAKAIRIVEPIPGMLRITVNDADDWVKAREREARMPAPEVADPADHPLPAKRKPRATGHRPLFPEQPQRLPRKTKARDTNTTTDDAPASNVHQLPERKSAP